MHRSMKFAMLSILTAMPLLLYAKLNFNYQPIQPYIVNNLRLENSSMGATNNAKDIMIINNVGGVWHRVQRCKVVAFSAYYDERMKTKNAPEVKVITQLHCKEDQIFSCKLYFTHNHSATVKASVQMINSGCGAIYEAHFIVCPIPKELINLYPNSLQLFADAEEQIELVKVVPHLTINYPPSNNETHKLAICVGAMVNFSDWLQLSFFIEFYKLMGATKFVFYTRSYSRDVEMILKHYERLGLVDLIPFPLAPDLDLASSSDVENGTHYTFQNLYINDCHYRLIGKAEYVANVDADEFMLPSAKKTLVELLKKNDVGQDWDGFLFRSRYYQLSWPHFVSLKEGDSALGSFVNLSTVVYPYSIPCPFDYRTKSINKLNSVVRVSVHSLHESLKADPLLKAIDLDQAVIVHIRKLKTTEKPMKTTNLPEAFKCASAADNVPSDNPFAEHFDKLVVGINSTIHTAFL